MKQQHITLSIGTLFLLIASWFGITHLHDLPLYYDETVSILAIGNPYKYNNLSEIIDVIIQLSAQHPPGHYWLIALWARLSGYSQMALRVSSVFTGLIALAFIYRLGKDAINRHVGLLAMGLAAVNTLFLFHLSEIRMYQQAVLVTTLFLWAYLRVYPADKDGSRIEWFGLYLATFGLLFSHYIAIFSIFGVCLFHLLFVQKNRKWWFVVLTFGLAGLSFLPWFNIVVQGTSEVTSLAIRESAVDTLWLMALIMGNGNLVLAIIMVASIVGAVFLLSGKARYIFWAFIFALGAFAIVQQIVRIMPDYRLRYLLLFYPLALILWGVTIKRFVRPVWAQAGLLLVWFIVGMVFYQNDKFWYFANRADSRADLYPSYPELMNFYYGEQLPSNQDVILGMSTYEDVFGMEYANEFYSLRVGTPMLSMLPSNWETLLPETFPNLDTAPSIWWTTVEDPDFADIFDDVEAYIGRSHTVCDTYTLNNGRALIRYGIATLSCDWYNANSTTISYAEEDIELQTTQATITDSIITIGTAWDVGDTVRLHQYSAALRVYDAEGNFVTDTNFPLPYGRLAQHIAQIPLNETDSATYEVRVIVYDWQTGDTLTANTTNSEIAPLLTLSTN